MKTDITRKTWSGKQRRAAGRWLIGLTAVLVPNYCPAEDPHAHHHPVVAGYTRTVQDYRVPDVTLLREDGVAVPASGLFETDRAVVVSFIFTSCSAICPVLTATLAQTRKQLGQEADRVRIVSVSIDPEYDTPARLRDYARQFQAGGDWHFFTGERAAIVALQSAFNTYRGDKNNHVAVALLRPAGQSRWVRLEGFTSANELVAEIRRRPES